MAISQPNIFFIPSTLNCNAGFDKVIPPLAFTFACGLKGMVSVNFHTTKCFNTFPIIFVEFRVNSALYKGSYFCISVILLSVRNKRLEKYHYNDLTDSLKDRVKGVGIRGFFLLFLPAFFALFLMPFLLKPLV